MKNLFFLTLFLVLGTSHAFPFETEPNCENMTFKPAFSFYGNNRLSAISAGRGYTGVASEGSLTASNLNPASLNIPNTAQIFYEYGKKNEYSLDGGINSEIELSNYKAAASYGAGYRINERLNIGLLYNKAFNMEIGYGSVENYDCSGTVLLESFDLYEKVAMSILSIPVSYKINNILTLGVGINTHIYHAETSRACYNSNEEWDNFRGKIDFVLFRPKVGFLANLSSSLAVGATFVPPTSKRIKEKVVWQEIRYEKNSFPTQFAVGTKFSLDSIPLSLLADYRFSNEAISAEFIDKQEASFGVESNLSKNFTLRAGYLYQNDYRNKDYVSNESLYWCKNDSYEQNFITAGASLKWRKTTWDVAIMHSGFTSDLAQTYAKLGLSLDLDQP